MFLKTARSFEARFTHILNLPKLQVAIYTNDENQAVSKIPLGPNFVTLEKVKAAAVIPVRPRLGGGGWRLGAGGSGSGLVGADTRLARRLRSCRRRHARP